MLDMRVRDVMKREVVTIEAGRSCEDAATRMARHKIRHLPVVDERGALGGVVTDRDLRRQIFTAATAADWSSGAIQRSLVDTPVAKVMSAPPLSIGPAAPLADGVERMREHRVGSLPVVDGGRIVGLLTETDVLRLVFQHCAFRSLEVESVLIPVP